VKKYDSVANGGGRGGNKQDHRIIQQRGDARNIFHMQTFVALLQQQGLMNSTLVTCIFQKHAWIFYKCH